MMSLTGPIFCFFQNFESETLILMVCKCNVCAREFSLQFLDESKKNFFIIEVTRNDVNDWSEVRISTGTRNRVGRNQKKRMRR